MIEFTREKFKDEFGVEPGYMFDLKKCIENIEELKIDAIRFNNPNLAQQRAQYGTMVLSDNKPIIYCLHVAYWIANGRFRASIQKVIVFEDQTEQDLYKATMHRLKPVMPYDN